MTTLQLADNLYPTLLLQDTVTKALQLMSDFKTAYLPVISGEVFLGLVSESDINEEENKETTLEVFQSAFIPASINANHFFLKAANIHKLYHTNVIPVVNDNNELLGTISSDALINGISNFCGSSEYGALIILEIERSRYAISEINSIVESDGATILHLNVSPHPVPGYWEITLQLDKKEIAAIIPTFERYGYIVSYYSGEELFENDLGTNYHNLMNYLDM